MCVRQATLLKLDDACICQNLPKQTGLGTITSSNHTQHSQTIVPECTCYDIRSIVSGFPRSQIGLHFRPIRACSHRYEIVWPPVRSNQGHGIEVQLVHISGSSREGRRQVDRLPNFWEWIIGCFCAACQRNPAFDLTRLLWSLAPAFSATPGTSIWTLMAAACRRRCRGAWRVSSSTPARARSADSIVCGA